MLAPSLSVICEFSRSWAIGPLQSVSHLASCEVSPRGLRAPHFLILDGSVGEHVLFVLESQVRWRDCSLRPLAFHTVLLLDLVEDVLLVEIDVHGLLRLNYLIAGTH